MLFGRNQVYTYVCNIEHKSYLAKVMLKTVQLAYLIIFCTLVRQVSSTESSQDPSSFDVFHAGTLNGFDPRIQSEIPKLNKLLVDRTSSVDPNENFDVILEELILDYRNRKHYSRGSVKIKRLILGLSTIFDEGGCSHHGRMILLNNYWALGANSRQLRGNKESRIGAVVLKSIDSYTNKCDQFYFKKFDEMSKDLDSSPMANLNILFERVFESLTSEELAKNKDNLYVERLYDIASNRISNSFEMEPSDIHIALKLITKDDPDKIYLQAIEDSKTGLISIKRDKFDKILYDYVGKPCNDFKRKFGHDVFEPIFFDSVFNHQIQANRVDFYEAWVKYGLCNFNGSFKQTVDKVVEYLEHCNH